MNEEILDRYFTDRQMAKIVGISLGGLRNKLYRHRRAAPMKKGASKASTLANDELPSSTEVSSKLRLWSKATTRTWLMAKWNGDAKVVDSLMRRGESEPPHSNKG